MSPNEAWQSPRVETEGTVGELRQLEFPRHQRGDSCTESCRGVL